MITKLTTNYVEQVNDYATYTGINPDIYIVIESNKTGEANFYFEVSLSISGNEISKYRVIPNEAGRAVINVTRIIKLHTINITFPNSVEVIKSLNYVSMLIKAREYYNNSAGGTQTTTIYVQPSYYRTLANYLRYGYVINQFGYLIYNPTYFNFNDANVREHNYLTINCPRYYNTTLQDNYTVSVTIGTVTKTTTLTAGGTYCVNLYHWLRSLGFFPAQILSATAITLRIYNTDNEHVVILKKSATPYQLVWRNELGGFSSLPIVIVTEATDTTHTTYNKGVTYANSMLDNARPITAGVKQVEKFRLVSDWLDDESAKQIYKSVMASRDTFLFDGYELVPISVQAQNITHKKLDFEDLINIDLTAIKNTLYV